MNVLFCFISGITFLICAYCHAEPLQIDLAAESAILINADTGVILFEKNAHALQYPASTTKVATAIYALHQKKDNLNQVIVAPQEALVSITDNAKRKANYSQPAYWLEPDGTHIGIKKDEELTLRDLMNGMLIASGNDAANVIAHTVGEGSIPRFMEGLNAYLKRLGCQQTLFLNPHGLHHPQHQTTAYDLALMAKEGLKDPVFSEIVSQTRFIRPKSNKQKATVFLQTNRLLRQGKLHYPKAIGVKTGYHSRAKKTFVGAARTNGRTLIAVLLKYEDRNRMFEDAIKLFDAAFNQPKLHRIFLKAGPQKLEQTLLHADQPLKTYLKEDLSLDYYLAEDPQPKCLIYWNSLNLPVSKDQKVGELHLVDKEGRVLKKATLLSIADTNFKWPFNWLSNIRHFSRNHPFLIGLACLAILGSLLGGIWSIWARRQGS